MTLLSDRVASPGTMSLDLPAQRFQEPCLATPLVESEVNTSANRADGLLSAIAAPVPDLAAARSMASPGFDNIVRNPLDAMVGAHINPVPAGSLGHSDEINLREPRALHLRLPSFELLGISNATASQEFGPERPSFGSPNAFTCNAESPSIMGHQRPSATSCGCAIPSAEDNKVVTPSRPTSRRLIQPQNYITTITPPDDHDRIFWQDTGLLQTSNESSPSPENCTQQIAASHPQESGATRSQQRAVANTPAITPQPRIKIQRTESDQVAMTTKIWLRDASDIISELLHLYLSMSRSSLLTAIVKSLEDASDLHGSIRVLSHALPCPSKKGFAFPIVLNSLHDQTPGSPTCWINVFHALPGRYNLSDLPSSPPATPAAPGTGDDYFTSKVFDSAIPILDYQNNVASTPKRAHPIVPPGTVHVSIVERYIPPTSANEFSDMFDVNGRSLLVDRLIEISPDNGTLLFIYPTKTGSETFLKQYLAPILDPVLRSMCVVNNLSVDLGSTLGHMEAVSKMQSFEELIERLIKMCTQLGQPGSSIERLQSRPAKFTLEHSTRHCVRLDREVWAQDWWVKQEKPRVRNIVAKYFRIARRLPADSELMPTTLIHEVLDGVASRGYADGEQPSSGIEVGVFVIKRTA